MIIATHPGTGTDIVRQQVHELGASLRIVTTVEEAASIKFDRLVLLGGGDINPFFYGQPRKTYTYPADKQRDRVEWILTRRAMGDNKPILGICRGHQMIAVAHGGTLYQDIGIEANIRHGGGHRLENIKQPLKRWLPTANVNSLHHQAVKQAPAGFGVVATAGGVIEAIWKPGVLGVQWHPELLLASNRAWGDLFVWLIEGRLAA